VKYLPSRFEALRVAALRVPGLRVPPSSRKMSAPDRTRVLYGHIRDQTRVTQVFGSPTRKRLNEMSRKQLLVVTANVIGIMGLFVLGGCDVSGTTGQEPAGSRQERSAWSYEERTDSMTGARVTSATTTVRDEEQRFSLEMTVTCRVTDEAEALLAGERPQWGSSDLGDWGFDARFFDSYGEGVVVNTDISLGGYLIPFMLRYDDRPAISEQALEGLREFSNQIVVKDTGNPFWDVIDEDFFVASVMRIQPDLIGGNPIFAVNLQDPNVQRVLQSCRETSHAVRQGWRQALSGG
jgi:hypothetical protein